MKIHSHKWLALSALMTLLPLHYASADPDCSKLVLDSKWGTEKVGGYFAGAYPSLQVTLERAGCMIGPEETEQIFQEILAQHEQDPQWNSLESSLTAQQKRDSVRFQLECQLSLSPVPDPITLEPMRKGVSLDAFKKMKCNTP